MDPVESGFPAGEAPESVIRSVTEAEVSLDEMLSLACRQGKQDIVELLLESGANVNHKNKAGNTPLLEACSQGHVSIARLLLDRKADIDAPTETTYDSALTWACTLGNDRIVSLLLERKANVEHRTKDGCTALMFAALAGHERVARLLLDHKAEINVESDSNKDSPLTFACWKGHQKVVELFLGRRADIEHRTKEGFSPLMFAALGGHTQVAELLLKHAAQVSSPSGSNNDIPLTSACWKGHHQVVHLLLQHNSNIEHRTKDGCTPLMLAAREGHLSVAELLLRDGAKVNVPSGSENNIPLTLACWKGHHDVVDLLLKHRSNIEHQNKAGCTPLMLAAREGHYEATQLLLDSVAQINIPSGSNDDTPLTLACWKGHENVVQLLIERNSYVNHQTKTGCTPLMEATREGHVGVARQLLEAGADVEIPDNYGQSPFFMACWKGHADVAALLLEYDANKDCRTKTGITPLFQACRENHVDIVKLLLDYGCNPSTPFPNSRESPLTLAAEKGFVDLSQLLLSRNANIECRTKKGCTPFFLACKEGFKEISIMLAKHGADTESSDQRGATSLMAAFRNGHTELVDWLLGHVTHLPSDLDCQRALMAPMPPDTDLLPPRTKCLEMIMRAKKAREQAALRNAQSLFDELDAEREKRESKKKAAAKKRSKRKEKKRNKEQADRMDAMEDEGEGEEQPLPVEDREEPEGEASGTLSHPPLPTVLAQEVPPTAADPTNDPPPNKRRPRKKRRKKHGEVEEAVPSQPVAILEDSNDSADDLEYHDAQSELPEFSLPVAKVQPTVVVSPTPTEPPKEPVKSKEPEAPKPPPVESYTQPRGNESWSGIVISNKKDSSKVVAAEERNKTNKSKKQDKPVPKIQKILTKGEKMTDSTTSITKKIEVLAPEPKPYSLQQTLPISRPRNPGTKSSKQAPPRLVKSGNSDQAWKPVGKKDLEKPAESILRQSPTDKLSTEDAGWAKVVSRQTASQGQSTSTSPQPRSHVTPKTNQISSSAQPSNQFPASFASKVRQHERAWNSSQESASDWGSEEMDLEELRAISSCSTDDDKIRSQKLKAAAAVSSSQVSSTGEGGTTGRSMATTASPTPTLTSTSTSSTSSQWQEVTRTNTRIVQRVVSNSLVGRVIGRGGSKINNIQEISGAHIMVSKNTPKSTDRVITIKGTQRSISKAQELIDEALSTPDRDIDISPPRGTSPEENLPLPCQSPSTRLRPRHSDLIPSSVKPLPTPQPSSIPPPSARVLSRAVSFPSTVIAPSTQSEPSTYIPTNPSSSFARISSGRHLDASSVAVVTSFRQETRPCAWASLPQEKESTVARASPLHSSLTTKALSPDGADKTSLLSGRSETPPSLVTNKNPSHNKHKPPKPPLTPDPTTSDPTSEPQSLRKHSRSMSDPQLSSDQTPDVDQTNEQHSLPPLTSPSTEANKMTSMQESAIPNISGKPPEKSIVGSSSGKMAATVAPSRPSVSVATSSVVGRDFSGITRVGRNVAVIQPTQHHVSLPSPSIPVGSQNSSSSAISNDPMSSNRRSSLPAGVPLDRARKIGYAGLQWSQGQLRPVNFPSGPPPSEESDPFSPPTCGVPPSGHTSATWKSPPFPLGSSMPPGWLSSIPEGDRSRSFSWAGQPVFGGPFTPADVPVFHHHPHVVYMPKPEELQVQPVTPDTPHGENLPGEPWSDKEFHSTAGIYGAIGSSVPNNPATSQPNVRPFSTSGYNEFQRKPHGGDTWSHSVGFGPVMPQQPLDGAPHGFQPFPHHVVARPFRSPHPPSPHMHRAMIHPHSPGPPTPSSLDEEPCPPNPMQLHQKRWSVPSFVYSPHLAAPFQPTLAHHPETHSWGGYVHGRPSVAEPEGYKQPRGGFLPSNDPWGSGISSSNPRDPPSHRQSELKPGLGRSVSVGLAEPWSRPLLHDKGTTEAELQQLMQSLSIAEHLHVLKDRKLSLQQLHALSDEEWRSLKLPVGPRVKLMNAVSNIARTGGKLNPSEPSSPPSGGTTTTTTTTTQADAHFQLQGTLQ